jgi:hypothetical protein
MLCAAVHGARRFVTESASAPYYRREHEMRCVVLSGGPGRDKYRPLPGDEVIGVNVGACHDLGCDHWLFFDFVAWRLWNYGAKVRKAYWTNGSVKRKLQGMLSGCPVVHDVSKELGELPCENVDLLLDPLHPPRVVHQGRPVAIPIGRGRRWSRPPRCGLKHAVQKGAIVQCDYRAADRVITRLELAPLEETKDTVQSDAVRQCGPVEARSPLGIGLRVARFILTCYYVPRLVKHLGYSEFHSWGMDWSGGLYADGTRDNVDEDGSRWIQEASIVMQGCAEAGIKHHRHGPNDVILALLRRHGVDASTVPGLAHLV